MSSMESTAGSGLTVVTIDDMYCELTVSVPALSAPAGASKALASLSAHSLMALRAFMTSTGASVILMLPPLKPMSYPAREL